MARCVKDKVIALKSTISSSEFALTVTGANNGRFWEGYVRLLQHLSPLGWEHINLTGDYVWANQKRLGKGFLGHCGSFLSLNVRYNPFSVVSP